MGKLVEPLKRRASVRAVVKLGLAVLLVGFVGGSLSGNGGTGPSGGSAFTGSDIGLLVIAAAALLTIRMVIVKMSRQRQHAG